MSWDVVLFNTKQKFESIEDLDDEQLAPTDFCAVFEKHFSDIVAEEDHPEIKGIGFAINYFVDEEPVSNTMLSLYGENGLYELVKLARIYHWQIFDTGLGEMIDLEDPARNGYQNFQAYLKQILS